jgi:hypothetical protein
VRHRKPDGFVILPAAFSDGRLSREAWRAVKACLSTVRTKQRPSGLRFRAVSLDRAQTSPPRSSVEVPIRATWVEVWRAIHRVHARGALLRSGEDVGVAVEPLQRATGERNKN